MQAGSDVRSTVVSQDARIVSGEGGKVIIWNATTHQKALDFTSYAGYVRVVDISGNSTRIASAGDDTAGMFSITFGVRPFSPLTRPWVRNGPTEWMAVESRLKRSLWISIPFVLLCT